MFADDDYGDEYGREDAQEDDQAIMWPSAANNNN